MGTLSSGKFRALLQIKDDILYSGKKTKAAFSMKHLQFHNTTKDRTIAYCGVPGSFSHGIAVRHFGKDNVFLGTLSWHDVFELMEKGEAEYGVIPLGNNSMGAVRENFDDLCNFHVHILSEAYSTAIHCLLGVKVNGKSTEERVAAIRKVLSHPKALEQCKPFLDAHPQIEPTFFSDTGRASQYVSDLGDPTVGAIASMEAARIYNLDILLSQIELRGSSITRYALLCRDLLSDPEANKASIVIKVRDKPGELFKVLRILADENYNLIWIEQRPDPEDIIDARVFMDFSFPSNSRTKVHQTLASISNIALNLKVLGIYRSLEEPVDPVR